MNQNDPFGIVIASSSNDSFIEDKTHPPTIISSFTGDYFFLSNYDTNGSFLIEGNDWGDQEWGVCNGIGDNKLGKILMQVRSSFII